MLKHFDTDCNIADATHRIDRQPAPSLIEFGQSLSAAQDREAQDALAWRDPVVDHTQDTVGAQ